MNFHDQNQRKNLNISLEGRFQFRRFFVLNRKCICEKFIFVKSSFLWLELFRSIRFILLYTDFSWRNISLNREKDLSFTARKQFTCIFRVNYGKCQDKPIVRRDNYNSHRSENFNHGSLNYSVPILGFKIYFSCKKRLQNELLIHKNIFNLLSVWQNLVLFISY